MVRSVSCAYCAPSRQLSDALKYEIARSRGRKQLTHCANEPLRSVLDLVVRVQELDVALHDRSCVLAAAKVHRQHPSVTGEVAPLCQAVLDLCALVLTDPSCASKAAISSFRRWMRSSGGTAGTGSRWRGTRVGELNGI